MHKAARPSGGVGSSNPHHWRGKRLHHHGDVCCVVLWLCVAVKHIICKKVLEHNLKVHILPYYKVNGVIFSPTYMCTIPQQVGWLQVFSEFQCCEASKSMQTTPKPLQIKIPVSLYDCTIHSAKIHPLIIILSLITIGLGWEFRFLVPISGTPIGSRILIPFLIPKIPVKKNLLNYTVGKMRNRNSDSKNLEFRKKNNVGIQYTTFCIRHQS